MKTLATGLLGGVMIFGVLIFLMIGLFLISVDKPKYW